MMRRSLGRSRPEEHRQWARGAPQGFILHYGLRISTNFVTRLGRWRTWLTKYD